MLELLKTYISLSSDLAGFPLTSDGAFAIAEALNKLEGKALRSRFVNARTVLAELGLDGAIILDKIEKAGEYNSAVKWAMRFMAQDSGIDIGHPGTQGMIDQLVGAGVLTASEGAAVKGLALQPITRAEAHIDGWVGRVTYQQVETARSL